MSEESRLLVGAVVRGRDTLATERRRCGIESGPPTSPESLLFEDIGPFELTVSYQVATFSCVREFYPQLPLSELERELEKIKIPVLKNIVKCLRHCNANLRSVYRCSQ